MSFSSVVEKQKLGPDAELPAVAGSPHRIGPVDAVRIVGIGLGEDGADGGAGKRCEGGEVALEAGALKARWQNLVAFRNRAGAEEHAMPGPAITRIGDTQGGASRICCCFRSAG